MIYHPELEQYMKNPRGPVGHFDFYWNHAARHWRANFYIREDGLDLTCVGGEGSTPEAALKCCLARYEQELKRTVI